MQSSDYLSISGGKVLLDVISKNLLHVEAVFLIDAQAIVIFVRQGGDVTVLWVESTELVGEGSKEEGGGSL